MMLGIGKEAAVFLYAGLSGIVIFTGYRILCQIRRLIRHSELVVNLEDILYWIWVSLYTFRQMYLTTYGKIRWFFVLGNVLGVLWAFGGWVLLKKIYVKCKKILEKYMEKR